MKREIRIPGIRRLLRLPPSRRTIEREVEEEIRFHLESRVRELVDGGMPEDLARLRANEEFGDASAARRELAEVDRRRLARDRRALFLDSLAQDLQYALRGLRRQPAFTAMVVATLTLGIGANAVVFGIVDRLLLRPPAHVVEPDRVMRINYRERSPSWLGSGEITQSATAYPMVDALRDGVPALDDVAGYFRSTYTFGRGRNALEVSAVMADGNYFALLGVQPALGRFFTPADDAMPAGTRVAVLSWGFWQTHYGGRADVLDSAVVLDGTAFDVIGVAPRGFTGVDLDRVDMWVPTTTLASKGFDDGWRTTANAFWIRAIARLAPDIPPAQAEARATVAYRREVAEWNHRGRDSLGTVVLSSLIAARGPTGISREARVSMWLMGVSAIVLLIACANIANLLIARALRRRREIAVRLALGVGRVRLARQLVTETLLLAGIAAIVALVVAHWGGALVRAVLLPAIEFAESPVSMRVVSFTLAATVLTGVLAGLAPALHAMRTDVSTSLRTGSREGGGRRSPLRTTLLVAQAGLSVVLLVGAGLFVRSLHNLRGIDVGLDLDRVHLVRLNLARLGFEREQSVRIHREALERVKALPGVQSATLVSASVPMRVVNGIAMRIPGRDSLPPHPNGGPYFSVIDDGFMRTIGARVLRGRDLTDADLRIGARVMLINETMAEHYWPGRDPVGECVFVSDDEVCTTIVGVTQTVLAFSLRDDERGMMYLPSTHPLMAQRAPSALLVRVDPRAPVPIEMLRRELQGITPDMPYVAVQPFEQLVAPELQPWRLGATLFGIFGVVALLIAAVGLYSVIAYLVSQRTHEIGVRMALGAARSNVVALVMREGVWVAIVGLALGLAAALVAGRFVAELLYETSPRDPSILAGVAAILALVAVAAALVPSWRASRVDPATALRAE